MSGRPRAGAPPKAVVISMKAALASSVQTGGCQSDSLTDHRRVSPLFSATVRLSRDPDAVESCGAQEFPQALLCLGLWQRDDDLLPFRPWFSLCLGEEET